MSIKEADEEEEKKSTTTSFFLRSLDVKNKMFDIDLWTTSMS